MSVLRNIGVGVVVVFLVMSAAMSWWVDREAQAKREREAAEAQRLAELGRQRATACLQRRAELVSAYEAAAGKGQWAPAAEGVRVCANATGDPQLRELLGTAEAKLLVAYANDAKNSIGERLLALDQLRARAPAEHAKLVTLEKTLERSRDRVEAAERRARGVELGMSPDDVLRSAWGKPRKINRTTNPWSVREQWVYEGGYLYFENGVLVTIQN